MGIIRTAMLATLVVLLTAPSPAHARGGGCKNVHDVVARNAVLKVYWGPKDVDDSQALCATYRGRRPYPLSFTSLDSGPDGKPVVAGHHVFVIDRYYDRGTGDTYAMPFLANVAKRRIVHQWEFHLFNGDGYIDFPVVRLVRRGSVAFSVGLVQADVMPGGPQSEIHRAMGAYQDTLAAGPDVDAASLRFSKERMDWTEAGQSFSATFF